MTDPQSAPPNAETLPVIRITPPRGWISLNLSELWAQRELLFFLTWRDIKVKYKQSLLGFAWAIIVPFTQMLIFGTIFGQIARLPSDGLNPYLFYLAGLVPWQYFANALTQSSNSLVGFAQLLTKIYLPRLFIPIGSCMAGLIDFFIAFVILLVMIVGLGITPAATTILLPVLILIAFATALGAGLILSAMNVKYRDVKFIVPFLVQIWMYCSVLLPFSKIPASWGVWRYLYGLNPMAGVIEGFRWCLLHPSMSVEKIISQTEIDAIPSKLSKGQQILTQVVDSETVRLILVETERLPVEAPWVLIAVGLPGAAFLLVAGLYYFKRMEKMFADLV
jgi:lipopolysaccharide transport system permease protein